MEKIDKWVEQFYEFLSGHPKAGLLFIIALLSLLLTGIIFNWKWSYEANSLSQNLWVNILSKEQYRFWVGVAVTTALACAIGLLFFY